MCEIFPVTKKAKDDELRDTMLLRALKTRPQPRPKRDRTAKPNPTSNGVESATSKPMTDR